jgi:hypothetical protein
MNLQEQVQSQLIRKREEWENLAVLALSAAFKCTPVDQHEELLNNVYTKIINKVFQHDHEHIRP